MPTRCLYVNADGRYFISLADEFETELDRSGCRRLLSLRLLLMQPAYTMAVVGAITDD